ncbi:Crp/Fnr family transcriptional regulator [Paenibacillus sp. PL91]|uniref:Crp/Fnr family transcriptional regulator n=1 Tax=Paenibacillus sp. PL91 TaxID=2729538 RepID=UPI00145F8B98|nr:Crp/Fnr family transcriptional regulator [Paenibacillus sp. PL91]MBC9198918.1 Crp/Fnr family transcriptional regulator [Paenibacillus sp. PL91]
MSSTVLAYIPQIISLFPSLSDISEQDWNTKGIEVLEIMPNFIIQEGHFLEHAVMLLEGTVRMYKISSSGREITLYRINGGECCPLMISSILGESEYEASACIEKPCLALLIPIFTFRDWMDQHRNFRLFMFKSLANRIIIMSNLLDSINFKSIRGRISEYLIQMTMGSSGTLSITHDAMSIELGTAREVISRTLKLLEKEQLIALSRGKISIINRDGLENYVES